MGVTANVCLTLQALLFYLACTVQGQVFFKGGCPDPPTVPDFNIWLFEGTWYETYRWYDIKEKGNCMRHTFTDLGYGQLDVLTEMVRSGDYEYRRGLAYYSASKLHGYGDYKHALGQSKYTLNYDDRKGARRKNEETYFILDTDYWTYAIVWSCNDKNMFNYQRLRIFTRSPYPHSHTLLKVYRELEYMGLDQEHLIRVDDKNECKYQIAQTHYKKEKKHYGKGGYGHHSSSKSPSYTSLLTEVSSSQYEHPVSGYSGYSSAGEPSLGYSELTSGKSAGYSLSPGVSGEISGFSGPGLSGTSQTLGFSSDDSLDLASVGGGYHAASVGSSKITPVYSSSHGGGGAGGYSGPHSGAKIGAKVGHSGYETAAEGK